MFVLVGHEFKGAERDDPMMRLRASDFLRVADRFEGAYELNFHLAPPLLG
jgi:hypothetical protein